jgi:hypothetical protein
MPLAEDQHPVGDLGPGREHEPFRIGVRARAPGWDLHGLDADASQERVEGRGELPGPVPDQDRKSAARSPRSIKRLRIRCVVHGPSGFAVTPRICTYRESISITRKQDRRCRLTEQSSWKKSAASIVAACARRKFRHVVSVLRWGAGAIFSALRTRRMVDALTRRPCTASKLIARRLGW